MSPLAPIAESKLGPHDALRHVVPEINELDYIGCMIEEDRPASFVQLWDLIHITWGKKAVAEIPRVDIVICYMFVEVDLPLAFSTLVGLGKVRRDPRNFSEPGTWGRRICARLFSGTGCERL